MSHTAQEHTPRCSSPSENVEVQKELGWVVEWYRLDQSTRISWMLARGAGLVALGVVLVGASFGYAGTGVGVALGTLGGLTVASGPLSTILGLRPVLHQEDYLIVRTRGLEYRDGEHCWWCEWDDVETIELTEDGAVVVVDARHASPRELRKPFYGTRPKQLQRRLLEVRRKAIWNLL